MGYRVINGIPYPVGNFPTVNQNKSQSSNTVSDKNSKSFGDILSTQIKNQSFNISKHAADRLKDVQFNNLDMQKINEGINKAQEKGAKNCLILYKDVALVTSIENRTVITAVDGERMKDNVFTNIDSVMVL
ncbi:MAG: TIGR02530 family flagellar biosynthesis protein [Bacillota bacterium]|nr:TIGR02530 family flagellar biosynthesis protein [Bacillota bacterium]